MRTATPIIFTPPFHPDYGLAHETREDVVRLVLDHQSSVEAAAMFYNLSPRTVRNWLKRLPAHESHPVGVETHNRITAITHAGKETG